MNNCIYEQKQREQLMITLISVLWITIPNEINETLRLSAFAKYTHIPMLPPVHRSPLVLYPRTSLFNKLIYSTGKINIASLPNNSTAANVLLPVV